MSDSVINERGIVMPGLIRFFVTSALLLAVGGSGRAQDYTPAPIYHPGRPVIQATQACTPVARSARLGTFYETPYLTVGGNNFSGGGGFSPLGQYGNTTMALYGPFAPYACADRAGHLDDAWLRRTATDPGRHELHLSLLANTLAPGRPRELGDWASSCLSTSNS